MSLNYDYIMTVHSDARQNVYLSIPRFAWGKRKKRGLPQDGEWDSPPKTISYIASTPDYNTHNVG